LDEHPWEETIPRLLRHASSKIRRLRWLGEKNGQPPKGVQPQDVVQEVIEKVFAGTRNWSPAKHPDLLLYLLDVVDSEVSNLATLAENARTQRATDVDPAGTAPGGGPDGLSDGRPTPEATELEREAQRQGDDFATEFWASLAGEPELQEVVEAIIDDVTRPAEIAARLSVRVDEIYARKKRLRLRLAAYQEGRRSLNSPKGVAGRA
jgi:DNA-directed RNA polymerase specialized sigma24 family protein